MVDVAGVGRGLGLGVPMGMAWAAWRWRRPDSRLAGAAMLASLWQLVALLAVCQLASRMGWWRFGARGGLLLGVPVDLLIGWSLLWGAVPVLATRGRHLVGVAMALVVLDLALMPACAPVVVLGPGWLIGELVAVGVGLIPGMLLARWTLHRRRLVGRATLQGILFGAILMWALPATVARLPSDLAWVDGLTLQLVALPGLLGIAAVREFVRRGRGTAFPLDPPQRMVTSGLYRYVANPMQLFTALLILGWGAWLSSWAAAGGGIIAVAFGAGIAGWCEDHQLSSRFGVAWTAYRRRVRCWLPRWRPWDGSVRTDAVLAPAPPARLYVASRCGPCSAIGRWFARRDPRGLLIVPAESHPSHDLMRVTYDPMDGTGDAEGVAALARGLEHIHLGWAVLGALIGLPGIRWLAQLIADASGGGPRLTVRR